MAKSKQLSTITREASLAARSLARLQAAADEALKKSYRASEGKRSFQMIAGKASYSALIQAPGLTVQIKDGDMAIDVSTDKE